MKFCQLAVPFWLWVILLSRSFRQMYGIREPDVHVTVINGFNDGRHVTIVCQSFAKGVAEKFLVKDVLAYPSYTEVQYDVGKRTQDSTHKCMTIWQRGDNAQENVNSIFEVFHSTWDFDVFSVWDPEDKVARFKWKLSELGLSLYSYLLRDFRVIKLLKSIQFINVYVKNRLQRRSSKDFYISCVSNQPHRHGDFLASRNCEQGEFVTWSVGEFDLETDQECKITFSDTTTILSFHAFRGIWHHDDSIWDEEKQERSYDWIVEDGGLHVRNFETKEDKFIIALP